MKPESDEDPLIDILARALGRWLPPVVVSSISEEEYEKLKPRNRRLDTISQVLFFAGLLCGAFLPLAVRGSPLRFKAADLGVLFGLGVALPTLFMALIAVFKGKQGLLDLLAFQSVKYGIDARKLLLYIYVPVILVGMVCAYFSYFAG